MTELAGAINLTPSWFTVVNVHYMVIESQLTRGLDSDFQKLPDWDAINKSKEGLQEVGKKFDKFLEWLGNASVGEDIELSLPSGKKTFRCVSLGGDNKKDEKL